MEYYPLFLDLKDRNCCVIGGGAVAERKTRVLLKCNARVTVISPELCAGLSRLQRAGKIFWRRSACSPAALERIFLVIAATNDRAVNAKISAHCRKKNVLVNVVDAPRESNFIVPSFVEKKGLIVAVSTGGRAPCLAKRIRQDLSRDFIPRYAKLLKDLSCVRKKLKSACPGVAERKAALKRFIDSRL